MPDIAKLVTLDLAQRKLYVDDVEFPWLISEEGPKFEGLADRDRVRSVTLTFFTEDVQVIAENSTPPDGHDPAVATYAQIKREFQKIRDEGLS